jgi:hypothetical protein
MTARGMRISMNSITSTISRRSYLSAPQPLNKFINSNVGSQRLSATSRLSCVLSSHAICRSFSVFQDFKPKPPESLTVEIAEGILDLTQFYCQYGISGQQFRYLASVPNLSTIERWQQMMEVYVTTQIHVVAGLGYESNAEGLNAYALHLAQVIEKTDDTMKELFAEIRRDTWRGVVGTVFQIKPKDIPILPIEQARELMHRVANRMVDPDILLSIQNQTASIQHDDEQVVLQMKHMILQKILVDDVYLGGSPSLVEQIGFGSGASGYVKVQCALSDHEGDPIMANYASTSMMKILSAAGIDIDKIEGPGLSTNPV